MGEGIQFLDILFFAMVAAFLVLRLRSVLGRRTGHERRAEDGASERRAHESRNDKVIALSDRQRNTDQTAEPERAPDAGDDSDADDDSQEQETPLVAGLTRIRAADSNFDPEQFLTGVGAAFEMIVTAFAAGDRKTLKSLLSAEVMENFEDAITAREDAGHRLETTLVSIKSAEIIDARLDGKTALVTVKVVSEQANVTYDGENHVVNGDSNYVATITDIWAFGRDTSARDPNWQLVETSSPN
ncbi:MAG: Tim44/TimA family putative adaptor protein [Alphaproteobacteria bacterium]